MSESYLPFNKHELLRGHSLHVLPLMVWVVADTKRLAISIGIPQCDWGQVLLGIYATVVAQSQGPVECRNANRTPEVNNLETVFDKLRSFRSREVTVNASS